MAIWAAVGLLAGGLLIINTIFAYQAVHIDHALPRAAWYHFKLLPCFFVANLMIGYGVSGVQKSLGSLTFSLSLAKGIELALCVLVGWWFMKEAPTWRTLVGLLIVLGGFVFMKWKPTG
ncbi:conserved hypothetical protein [Paenibacillus curdlanolyticus YK9]|uniref:EamA domain-containing protein n=1 Tax=Paenibacillus curdlanolyticus YK9 TaxID=717606 RepID=E0IE37_9BACL|nr:hypothetical protein [Paenibacillus curdlanolyticus]EFM09391.1 conserved hypothetical protein [Paenibacillus curdlanolyticus YK9]